jgi:hypothetical protein
MLKVTIEVVDDSGVVAVDIYVSITWLDVQANATCRAERGEWVRGVSAARVRPAIARVEAEAGIAEAVR